MPPETIYTSSLTLAGRIPVIRYVCLSCGYVENWVENPEQLEKLRRSFGPLSMGQNWAAPLNRASLLC